MAITLPQKLWTTDEYELLIEEGTLNKDHRVELMKGEIVDMAPIGLRHASCVINLDDLFHDMFGRTVTISIQNPVRLLQDSEPEPDIALLKGHRSHYKQYRPRAEDILLLVEVADSTLDSDRNVKVPLYAQAGIPEVWVVTLNEDVIEVYSASLAGRYGTTIRVGRGEMLALPGDLVGSVSVDEVLG